MAKRPLSDTLFAILCVATTGLFAQTIHVVFNRAPVEKTMGIVQKIFYFHVPSAYSMYVGYVTAAVGSLLYLWKRDEKWDALAVAGVEVGVLFCTIVLTTGPLWARKAWGVYWTWDPRLTTTLLAGMVYVAYLSLRSLGETGEAEKRFASGLAIVGAPTVLLIHYSVQRWRGVHPTVVTGQGGGLEPHMKIAFGLSMLCFTFLVAALIALRYRIERSRQRVEELTLRAAERGLLEES